MWSEIRLNRIKRFVHECDTKWHRWLDPDLRSVLVYLDSPMNYVVVEPVYRRMSSDSRVKFYFTTTPGAACAADIYTEAEHDFTIIPRSRAKAMRFDVCLAADFYWL